MILLLFACASPRLSDPAVLLLREMDTDGSGAVESGEVPANARRELMIADADRDGVVELEELRAYMNGPKVAPAGEHYSHDAKPLQGAGEADRAR